MIEHFLEPSFTPHVATQLVASEQAPASGVESGSNEAGASELSHAAEVGLMVFSVAVGVAGIWLAYRFYVVNPETSQHLAERWSGAHSLLTNKFYVDELYDATVVRGTLGGAFGSWKFDARVVDGAVNGSGWLTVFSSWISHLFDKYIVDGLVNLLGSTTGESSFRMRWLQTGLVQNYALWMLGGVFAFMTMYLYVLAR